MTSLAAVLGSAGLIAVAAAAAASHTQPRPPIAFLRGSEESIEVYVMGADGGSLRRLSHDRLWEDGLAWSPDGRSLAFSGSNDSYPPESAVYVAAVSGGKARRVTPAGIDAHAGPWSPDGRRMLVTSRRGLYTIAPDGTHLRLVARGCTAGSWSPDGRMLAASCGSGTISTMRADGAARRVLVRDAYAAAWSPDGRTLAVDRSDGIYTIAVDGTRVRRIVTGYRSDGHVWALHVATWSHDGRKIALGGYYGSPNHPPEASSIFVVNADGTGLRRLTDDGDFEYSNRPSWSPDGRRIAFSSRHEGEGSFDIFTIARDGSDKRQLTHDGIDDTSPVWSPR